MVNTESDAYVYCRECGAEIRDHVDTCPNCGTTQEEPESDDDPADQYSVVEWAAAVLIGFLSLPLGIIIPGYLYYKAQQGTGANQTSLETWTVILFGPIGIGAVELGGETGAKLLWGLFAAVIILLVLAIAG